ncbi:hypothetical protein [Geofilum rubicundum]|uniref:Uncharacterized protein n=1 Tax=Geofilum rubicundum JCM 15548 TaxID=1236989 RepID=A0A0E9LYQ4_9BACT|nr:hypothetical protein [Geofilum rubicundum]GAO30413.1 hypothetical protein JCM15548_12681 [Geofilum rubicundum JCM 15548]
MMAKKLIWTWMIMVVLMACQQPGNKKAQVYRGERPKVEGHFTEVVPLKGVNGLPDTNVVVVGDGPEKQQQYKASLKKLDGLISEIAQEVDDYEDQPVYWVEILGSGIVKTLLELNGIPFSYAYTNPFTDYRIDLINPLIEKSGPQQLKIRVFDERGLEYSTNLFLRVGYAPDIRQRESQPQYLTDSIKVPAYAQDWLTVYWDTTITFQAQVPWDYSERLARATDLRTLPNLEEQVLKKYEQLRQNFINCDVTEIVKQSAGKVIREYETNYIASAERMLSNIKRDLTIYAPNHPDKVVYPLAYYELALYKDGKLVQLRGRENKKGALRTVEYNTSLQEDPFDVNHNFLLYLPEGATELQVY